MTEKELNDRKSIIDSLLMNLVIMARIVVADYLVAQGQTVNLTIEERGEKR